MRRPVALVALALASLAALGAPRWARAQQASAPGAEPDPSNVAFDPVLYAGLEFRMIGPHRGGRVTAVEGFPDRPATFLMGAVGGGVWKTEDAGESWRNLTDGELDVGPVGAVAVAPADEKVIYVGTGSACPRGNVSVGNGIYRSSDGGRTWHHLGLPESHHIGAIEVHPRDPDRVYVAALGHVFGPNPERGVYRSTDGGESWEKVLFVSDSTGAVDLVMDPSNPRILYAAMWQAERKPWAMFSGAGEGGVYRTADGGDSWRKVDGGLPDSVGRVGVDVSPADPSRVWALVESTEEERGLYRSDDGGETWRMVSDDRNLMARPWYYMHVHAHPTDRNTVYVSNEGFYRSVDGGESWKAVPGPHGDYHALWINPRRPEVMIQGNDGGAAVTFNGGETWSTQLNQPTAEFYTVTVDDRFPYRIYAPQQDNTTISIPSVLTEGITPYEDWFATAGCETGPVAVKPDDPDVIYGGCKGRISRHDRKTGQVREVWVYPQEFHARANRELKFRRQWTSQIEFSPHDPDRLYHPSHVVHVTTNGGQTWDSISPDLTRWEEHAHLHDTPPGGPLTYDQTGVEIYGTIFAFEESPHRAGVLWAGSDDGAVHVSRDGGRSWKDVTPPGMELHTTVNEIVLSPHRPGKAYAAAHRYRMDDWRPLIWRTEDHGESWALLTDGENGIPVDHPTRTIQEDPQREGLLYAGTEFGLFVSFDDGERWQPLQLNLPETPVTDLEVHGNELVVATQGRSLWLLDDLTPVRSLAAGLSPSEPHLFAPADAYRLRQRRGFGSEGRWPENPPEGALFHYYLPSETPEPVELQVLDDGGDVVWALSSRKEDGGEDRLPTGRGTHRVSWDLRYPGAYVAPGVDETRSGRRVRVSVITGYTGGPYAVPGPYRVRLLAGSDTVGEESFRVRPDPRLEGKVNVEEMRENFELAIRVRDRISRIQRQVARINTVLSELEEAEGRVSEPQLRERAAALSDSLEALAGDLYKHGERGDHAHLPPRLTTSYARLGTMLIASDHRPTDSAHRRFRDLEPEFERHMARAERLLGERLTGLNRDLQRAGLQPVYVPPER